MGRDKGCVCGGVPSRRFRIGAGAGSGCIDGYYWVCGCI